MTALLELAPGRPVDWPAIEAWLAPVAPVAGLAATPQDPGFHAEGDVWTHTRMAVEALVASPAYAALAPEARRIVAAAVLLHDAGKPATTRTEGERITSRGHSARGELLARVALWRMGVAFDAREHVCALIRHHQVPFFGITRAAPDAERLAIRLSLATRNDWLALVAEADGRGRRCADPADQVRIVEHCALWAEHCRELGVLDRPQAFATPHTRVAYFEAPAGGRRPDVLAHDDTTCEVVVMAGLPASGKDTWLARHRPELPVIALDDLRDELEIDPGEGQARVVTAARERARAYLRAGTPFAWNATNLSLHLRAQVLELLRAYRARTHVVYCETSATEQARRNALRERRVPARVVERLLERWSVPDLTEAHEVTFAVTSGPE